MYNNKRKNKKIQTKKFNQPQKIQIRIILIFQIKRWIKVKSRIKLVILSKNIIIMNYMLKSKRIIQFNNNNNNKFNNKKFDIVTHFFIQ